MKYDVNEALLIIRKACSSVVADYATHQAIQEALHTIEDELVPKDSTEE
jgi:hypothetical protein